MNVRFSLYTADGIRYAKRDIEATAFIEVQAKHLLRQSSATRVSAEWMDREGSSCVLTVNAKLHRDKP